MESQMPIAAGASARSPRYPSLLPPPVQQNGGSWAGPPALGAWSSSSWELGYRWVEQMQTSRWRRVSRSGDGNGIYAACSLLGNDRKFLVGNSVFLSHQISQQ